MRSMANNCPRMSRGMRHAARERETSKDTVSPDVDRYLGISRAGSGGAPTLIPRSGISSLPQDLVRLQRHECTSSKGNHASGVVAGRTRGGHRGRVGVTTLGAQQLVPALHHLPDRLIALQRIGVQFHVRGIGVHIVQIYLDFKNMLTIVRFNLHLSKANILPMFAYAALPLDQIRSRL